MRLKSFFTTLILLFALGNFSIGQHLHIAGTVHSYIDGKITEPIEMAEVFLKNAKIGGITDNKGYFMIMAPANTSLPDTLIIRIYGFYADTIVIKGMENNEFKITLFPEFVADEVIIEAKRANSSILRLDPRNVERLDQGELRKAACCNLSESFSTNATVDVNFSDAISGAKQIQMLGLSGRYTQLQFENIPFMHNLDQPFGLASVPGTWINSIQITKGSGTVTNGYESMAGLINLEYHKPEDIETLFINGYGNIQGRAELNLHGGASVGEKWNTAWFVHGASTLVENDRNKDGFRDVPIGTTLIGMNKWDYHGEYFLAQIGVKVSHSDMQGGQIGYRRYTNQFQQGLYGVGLRNTNIEAFAKTGFLFKNDIHSSIGIIYYAKYDELSTVFGNRSLDGIEKRGYINAMHETIIGNTNHNIKSGLSFVFDDLNQKMQDVLPTDTTTRSLIRREIVPGIFSEYTYLGLRSTMVLGTRLDYHNRYGLQFTPRANYKFNITEDLDFRITAGRGFRVSNYVADNMSLMATNTPWLVEDNIKPEISWNFGGSLFWTFKLFENKASWSADFYHTFFTSQLIVDRDESADYIKIGNLDGKSFSNVFQTDFKMEPTRDFTIKMAYKWTDVRVTTGGELQSQLMVPAHRGLINFEYGTRNKRWAFDLTFSVMGTQRLAKVREMNGTLSENNMGRVMPSLMAQVTHRFKHFELYIGGEDLLDQRLKSPIIGATNPFGSTFDATRIYSSIYGANVYIGFRFAIERKEK